MSLFEVAQAVEASPIATAMRVSNYWFPLLNLVHLSGLLVAAGTVVFWDLRLLGRGVRSAPVSDVGKSLLPWFDYVFFRNGTRITNFYVRGMSLSAPSWSRSGRSEA